MGQRTVADAVHGMPVDGSAVPASSGGGVNVGDLIRRYGYDGALMALGFTRMAPHAAFGGTVLDATPLNASDSGSRVPATDAQLHAEAKSNADRRAAEPNALRAFANRVGGIFERPDFTPMPRDKYRVNEFDKRDPMPGQEDERDYVQRAGDRVRASDAYKKAVAENARRSAERLVKDAENAARQEYSRYVGRQEEMRASREGRFEGAYQQYVQERKDAQAKHYSRPFMERNPELGAASVAIPAAIAAIRYGRVLNTRAGDLKSVQALIADPKTPASIMPTLLKQEADLVAAASKSMGGKMVEGAGYAMPAVALSSTAKGLGDVFDASFLPPDAGARKEAAKKYVPFNDRGEMDLSGIRQNVGEFATRAALPIAAAGAAPLLARAPSSTAMTTAKNRGTDLSAVQKVADDRLALANIDRSAELNEALAQRYHQLYLQQAQRAKLPAGAGPPPPPGAPPAGPGGNPGGRPALPPAGGAGGGPVPPQGPQPGQGPGPQGGARGAYGPSEKAVARPYIEAEVAAGRNVPDVTALQGHLSGAGLNRPLPQEMRGKLNNAQAWVDTLRARGLSDSSIALILKDMMNNPAVKGLPAVAAGGMAIDYEGNR